MIKLSHSQSTALRRWAQSYPIYRSYLSVDLETSGLSVKQDRIVHFGWCIVSDTKAIRSEGVAVDWTQVLDRPGIEKFAEDLARTKSSMEARGHDYRWTVDEVRRRGVHPEKAAEKFLRAWQGLPMVAHHGWGFDYPMIGLFLKQTGHAFDPAHTHLMDTCLMARAILSASGPRDGEQYRSYVDRMSNVRCAKHTLRDCMNMFDLHELGCDAKHAHDAEYDAWIVFNLLERMRDASGVTTETVTPEAYLDKAHSTVQQLMVMTFDQRAYALRKLKEVDPSFLALVRSIIENQKESSCPST